MVNDKMELSGTIDYEYALRHSLGSTLCLWQKYTTNVESRSNTMQNTTSQYICAATISVGGKRRVIEGYGLTKGLAINECTRALKRAPKHKVLIPMAIVQHPQQ